MGDVAKCCIMCFLKEREVPQKVAKLLCGDYITIQGLLEKNMEPILRHFAGEDQYHLVRSALEDVVKTGVQNLELNHAFYYQPKTLVVTDLNDEKVFNLGNGSVYEIFYKCNDETQFLFATSLFSDLVSKASDVEITGHVYEGLNNLPLEKVVKIDPKNYTMWLHEPTLDIGVFFRQFDLPISGDIDETMQEVNSNLAHEMSFGLLAINDLGKLFPADNGETLIPCLNDVLRATRFHFGQDCFDDFKTVIMIAVPENVGYAEYLGGVNGQLSPEDRARVHVTDLTSKQGTADLGVIVEPLDIIN